MSLQRILAITFVAWLLAACATIGPIEVSGDPAAIPPFRTFRVLEVQFAFATDITADQVAKISSELRAAAVSALEERGYSQAADADVLVALAALEQTDAGRASRIQQRQPAASRRHLGARFRATRHPTAIRVPARRRWA